MQSSERDNAYLWDMLDAAQTALNLIDGYSEPRYLQDRVIQLAIERLIEIIGEAARCLSPEYRQSHPEIPWQGIIAQRNVLAHEYGEIKQDRMWRLLVQDLPKLVDFLRQYFPPDNK